MFICQYCGREGKSNNSNAQHEIRCKKNPEGIQVKPSYGMLGKKGANQYTYGAKMSDETRKKISEQSKNQVWSEEKKVKHSIAMREAVKRNPDSYSKNNVMGRVRNIEYNGVTLKGSWELKTAKWLDAQNETWDSEVNPQEYKWNGGTHLYFPDFYLPGRDIYIEVKGYKRERDEAKWSQFNGTLVIIDKKVIDKLEKYSIIDLCAVSSVVSSVPLITEGS